MREYYIYKNGYLIENGIEKENNIQIPFIQNLVMPDTNGPMIPGNPPPGGIDIGELIPEQANSIYSQTAVWRLTTENDMGLPVKASTGTVTREYAYDTYGQPTLRKAYAGSNVFQNQTYDFDIATGNLNVRSNNKYSVTESFRYDTELNRLTNIDNENGAFSTIYDDNGNITKHTQVGEFEYNHPTKPYALTDADVYGTVIPLRDQYISYNSFKRPATIIENGYTAQFTYNDAAERVRMQLQNNGSTTLTRYYIGNYEQDIVGTSTTERLYLSGDAYSAPAVLIKNNTEDWNIHYLCRDYLGSITHITNNAGTVVQELDYDAWGRLRNPQTHELYAPGSEPTLLLGRGYTGHEHLTRFGLINMNARLYDPAVGRFLSPDPYVQDATNSQNYNRYSYCLNNPLKYTDPSGEKRKDYTYNWYTEQYENENGDWASWFEVHAWMNTNCRYTSYNISSYGFDHLYTIVLAGETRLVGSIGGEVKGADMTNGIFIVTNNAIAGVLAANAEATAWGYIPMSDPNSNFDAFGHYHLYTQNETNTALKIMLIAAVTGLTWGTGTAAVLGKTAISVGTKAIPLAVNTYNYVAYSAAMVETGYATFEAAATVGGIAEGGLKYFTNAPNDPTMPYFSGNLFYQVATDYSNSFIWPFVDKKLLNR